MGERGYISCFSSYKIWYSIKLSEGFPGGSDNKESACNAGDLGSIPGSGRYPGVGNGKTRSSVFAWKIPCTGSLVGYSPRGHKESGMAGQLSTHTRTHKAQ